MLNYTLNDNHKVRYFEGSDLLAVMKAARKFVKENNLDGETFTNLNLHPEWDDYSSTVRFVATLIFLEDSNVEA